MKSLQEAQSDLLRTQAEIRRCEKDLERLRRQEQDLRVYITEVRSIQPPRRFSGYRFAHLAIVELIKQHGPMTQEELFLKMQDEGYQFQLDQTRARGDLLKSILRNSKPQPGKSGEIPPRLKILPDGRVDIA